VERLRQFTDTLALERDHVTGVDHFPVEDGCFVVKLDLAHVFFMFRFFPSKTGVPKVLATSATAYVHAD